MRTCARPSIWIISIALLFSAAFQSCTSTLKTVFIPPNVKLDTTGPHYLYNVSEIKYWDRITSADRATNFAWMDSTGKVHEMYEFYDKVVVLSFFGTWSPPSIGQLDIIDSARADTNVLCIAVAMKEGVTGGKAVTRIDSFARARGIPIPLLVGSSDFGFTYGGIDVVPTTFVITRRHKIAATFEGFVTEAKLLEAISDAEKK
jgi:peroxiredoxin